ncbi:MAG: hypothetical protein QM737_10680 [Ferruginibacter sp.]
MEAGNFNLQSEIKNYLNNLNLKSNLTHDDEAELEGHIYDGVITFQNKGLSTEEAFLIIIKRLGNTDTISEEYNKVNPFFVSNKIRSYSAMGLGLIISVGTILLFIYELINLYRENYLAQTSADMPVKALLYFGLCISVLSIFKWGKSFSLFLQKNIGQQPFLTASILFILPLISFLLQPSIIRFFDKSTVHGYFNFREFDTSYVPYINLNFYLLVAAVLFLAIVFFDISMKKQETPKKQSSLMTPVIFLIFFSLCICAAAILVRYIPQSGLGLQNSIFLAIVYTIGSFSIAFYNKRNLWLKLFIFSIFGLCLGNLLVI